MSETGIIITEHTKHLHGIAGGALEYVSQRLEWREVAPNKWVQLMIIRFTDHDMRAWPNAKLIEGIYYELEIRLEF